MKEKKSEVLANLFQILKTKKFLSWKKYHELTQKTSLRLHEPFLDYLTQLETLGALELKDDGIYCPTSFFVEANLNVTRRGLIFASSDKGGEVVILQHSLLAHHRDRVVVEILPILEKGRFCARLVEIRQPFAQEFLAKVVAEDKKGYLIQLIDLPNEPWGYLQTKAKLLAESYVIVKSTQAISQKHSALKKLSRHLSSLGIYEYREILDPNDLMGDMKRIALKYQLPLEYPKEAIPSRREVKQLHEAGLQQKDRLDLRHLYTCTIDGEDAKDFDDAISMEKRDDGYRLYVHIADVSHFVKPHTTLDREALRRGNSTYLTSLVLPMLPPILSEEFCSLMPQKERLCFSCILDFALDGTLQHYEFHKSIIYIHRRYSYEEAEKELEEQKPPLPLFWELAQKLMALREKAGRIELNIKETENILDEHGRLVAIIHKKKLRSHRIIEEFMLSANQAAAHLGRKHHIPMLHRIHESIAEDKLEKINSFLRLFGFSLALKDLSYREIHRALAAVANSKYESIFHYLLLRSFTQAAYQRENRGHWALAFRDYTHFTSPIRRYSDLVVHRQMAAFLKGEKFPHTVEELDKFGPSTTRCERISMEAERAMVKLLAIRFLQKQVGRKFTGWLTGFNSEGLFVSLEEPMVEGFVPASSFSPRGEVVALDDFRVVLAKWHKVVPIGTELSLRLESCEWEKIQLIFSILAIRKT
ncbi:MAG: ribonuclease R [Leptospiraceae bacterium]|nr:ribonuclease R [Leptospiraceae bacterium]MDW8306442.1 ribonuclease R [Leptospiraceae bacterium]